MCKISTKNIKLYGNRQNFKFFIQITWFLRNKRALKKLDIGFCLTQLLLLSYKKISPLEPILY